MSEYYINISLDSTGASGLTQSAPLGWNEFLSLTGNNTYRLRGSRTLTSGINFSNKSGSFERWDTEKLSPWRLNCGNNGLVFGAGLSVDGLIADLLGLNFAGDDITILNSYFHASAQIIISGATANIKLKGCSIFADQIAIDPATAIEIVFTDSILSFPSGVIESGGSPLVKFRNCQVTNDKTDFASVWVADSDNPFNKFSWDDSDYTWPEDALLVTKGHLTIPGITVPGTGVYAGYEYDVFGTSRFGIGAVTSVERVPLREGSYIRLMGDNSSVKVVGSLCEGIL
jgi:hypothetical protein